MSRHRGVALLVVGLGLALPSAASAEGPLGTQVVTLAAGEHRVVPTATGVRVEMDGFGVLADPGRPFLPERRVLVLLPPGARVRSLDAQPLGRTELPGTGRIAAVPPLLPLSDPTGELARAARAAWEEAHRAAFAVDEVYPGEVARIVGAGSLRKYAYAAVAFRPIAVRPLSGELIRYEGVRLVLEYELPAPGSEEARLVESLRHDTAADARARELFVNWGAMEAAYAASGAPPFTGGPQYDYVIITRSDLVPAIDASGFVPWKTSLGHDVAIVTTTDADIAGRPGRDLAERIRNFLRASWGPWGIEYVLMVGNYAAVPMRYCFPDPTRHAHNPSNPSSPGGSIPTDQYYSDLSLPDSLSWDLDRDGYPGEWGEDAPDLMPEIAIGRIPTNNAAWITGALEKSVRFEQDTGAWKDQALHAGAILFYPNQNWSGIPFRDGATCMDLTEGMFAGALTVTRFSEQAGLLPSTYPWPALTQASFGSAWRDGRFGIVNWAGHGSPDGAWRTVWTWDDGDGVYETGSDQTFHEAFAAVFVAHEDDYPSIVTAVSCNVAYPEPNPQGRLGVDLIAKPGFGAAAGIVASTRVAYVSADWPVTPGGAESICTEFNRHLVAVNGGEGMRMGDAFADAKAYCHLNYAWSSFPEYWDQFDYNLYGDPALSRRGATSAVGVREVAAFGPPEPGPRAVPNPSRGVTDVRFATSAEGRVRVEVFEVGGRRVAVLVDGMRPAGEHRVLWDGRTAEAADAPAGVYFYRVETAERTDTGRLVLLR